MATAVASKKQITRLTGKHFINWLQAQGSETVVGYIGDHVQYPIEMWLSDVLNCKMTVSSVDDFEYNGKQYRLSQAFSDFSICVQEGDLDELPECGWREVTAAEMLEQVEQYITATDMLVERPAKPVQEVHIIARYQFKADPRKVVYLVRSSDGSTTYQTCFFAGKATSCDCPAKKPCYHMTQLELREQSRSWAIPEGKSLVRDNYHPEENEAEHDGLVEAPSVALATPELEDEEQRLKRWTALELATLGKGPVPAGKAPTPRKVSMAWLCSRH